MTPPDDAPQTGQRLGERVWRSKAGRFIHEGYRYRTTTDEPGVWHPTDPKALAMMRTAIASKLFADRLGRQPGFLADQIMQAVGLTPPEPKEGGA